MTKKRAGLHHHPLRHQLCVGLQLVVTLSVLLCLLAVVRIHFRPADLLDSASPSALASIRDQFDKPFNGTAKIAFLFLARSDLPLDFLWNAFFTNAAEGNFSIYIHTRPGFEFDETTTRSEFFHGRHIKNSIAVGWGEASMIQAERLLVAAALEDPANQRFVLLSESCVPLYNFSYIYNYLMSSPKSFVDSFLDKKEGRYNPKMSPTIPKEKWRKGSQWMALVRKHAAVVVADDAIFSVFRKYCRRRAGLGPGIQEKQALKSGGKKEHNCIPDEHYVQTLLSMSDLEDELERRTLTYTLWNQSKNVMEKQSWHPMTFQYANASPQQIMEIKNINHVYYETEYRTEWCQCNNTSVPCFLFARKFSRGAATRLLNEGFVGPFDAASLLSTSS